MLKTIYIMLITLIFTSCESKDPSLVEYLFSSSNTELKALEFEPSSANCPKCRMPLKSKVNSAQVVFDDERTYIFDDIGCLILWIRDAQIDKKHIKIFVYTTDTHKWIDANKLYYSIKDNTPMGYGFSGYEKNQNGFIGFEEMSLKMLRGENMADPKIRKRLLGK